LVLHHGVDIVLVTLAEIHRPVAQLRKVRELPRRHHAQPFGEGAKTFDRRIGLSAAGLLGSGFAARRRGFALGRSRSGGLLFSAVRRRVAPTPFLLVLLFFLFSIPVAPQTPSASRRRRRPGNVGARTRVVAVAVALALRTARRVERAARRLG